LLTYSGLQDRDLSIFLVDNREIQALNQKFFGKDRPTNVISFSYLDGLDSEIAGEIIISFERVVEEAASISESVNERLLALVVHGLVHILGFDHVRGRADARRMRYREKKFLDFVKSHRLYSAENPVKEPALPGTPKGNHVKPPKSMG
jgi:rRNA maturation RNase YbeY